MTSTPTPTVSPERAAQAIVSQKLGGWLISAVTMAGGCSNRGLYRVRARLGGKSGEESEVIFKLAKVYGSPVTDDLDHARIYAARSWNLRPVHALLRAPHPPAVAVP